MTTLRHDITVQNIEGWNENARIRQGVRVLAQAIEELPNGRASDLKITAHRGEGRAKKFVATVTIWKGNA